MYEIDTENVYARIEIGRIFDFSSYSTKSKYYDDSKKFLIGKMKDEKGGASIKDIAGSKPKIYSFLIDRSSKHKQAKGGNKNVITTINDNEYKDVSLNKKCLRHSTNRIKIKDYRIVQ